MVLADDIPRLRSSTWRNIRNENHRARGNDRSTCHNSYTCKWSNGRESIRGLMLDVHPTVAAAQSKPW
jgi:hypothetical protein